MNSIRKVRSLRVVMLRSVAGVVLVLWAVVAALLTWGGRQESAAQAETAAAGALDSVRAYLNQSHGAWADRDYAALRLRYELSRAAAGIGDLGGGMVLRCEDPVTGTVQTSQMAFGWGFTGGCFDGEEWFLEFDSALDDAGQIAFAEKIQEHRGSGYLLVVRPESDRDWGAGLSDGTVVRADGVAVPGGGLKVRRLALVRPDGSQELLLETAACDESCITVELQYAELTTALWSDRQRGGRGDWEKRLAAFRWARQETAAYSSAELARDVTTRNEQGGVCYASGVTGSEIAYAWTYRPLAVALYELRWTYAFTLMLAALLALGLAHRLTVCTARPLERLCGQVKDGRPCRADSRIREINELAGAFETAREKLAEDLHRQKELTGAVAHELKTPAAILRAYAEALQEDIQPEKRAEYLAVIEEESGHMSALVGEVLELSRLEGGKGVLEREPVELARLVSKSFERLRLPMEERGLELILKLDPVEVTGDPMRLSRMINNLAVNVLRHAQPGPVRAALWQEGSTAVLRVENCCAPIPEQQLARLWEPFYKLDTARSREGSGLGLAVVKSVVELHSGACSAENVPGGLRIQVELPC